MSCKQYIDLKILNPCTAPYYPATENITAGKKLAEYKNNIQKRKIETEELRTKTVQETAPKNEKIDTIKKIAKV